MDEGTEDRLIEIVARMKSNVGSHAQWIKELEYELGMAEMTANLLKEIRDSQNVTEITQG
jgi:hypothetical protein